MFRVRVVVSVRLVLVLLGTLSRYYCAAHSITPS